jgi:hypothetical protein
MAVILALGKLKQKDLNFQVSLGYIVRPCLKKKKKKNQDILVTYTPFFWKYTHMYTYITQ